MACTSPCSARATRRQPRSGSCARSAPMPSACRPCPRPSWRGTWGLRCSGSRVSATWPPACCRSRSTTPRCSRQRSGCAASSSRSWRRSLAGSEKRGPSAADLVAAARRAREHAHAAFSHFKVGAALETADGVVVTGCNVENATYGLTICAERVAMFKALSEGHRAFTRIAVVADTDAPTPPCGACRQILWEFGGDLEIVLANLQREMGAYRLEDLLPLPFDARLLVKKKEQL